MNFDRRDVPCFLVLLLIFLLMKAAYSVATTNELLFLLYPVNFFVKILLGANSELIGVAGFFYEKYNFIIDKSCSGFNFWIISFVLTFVLFMRYRPENFRRALAVPGVMLVTGLYSILITSWRIYLSVILQPLIASRLKIESDFAHQAIGVLTYLTFLVFLYFVTERAFINLKSYAQPS